MRSVYSVLLCLLCSASGSVTLANGTVNQSKTQIQITETAFAEEVEGSQSMKCANSEWRVRWKSESGDKIKEMEILFFQDDVGRVLTEAARHFSQVVSRIESMSATCGSVADEKLSGSTLLILGLDKKDGTKKLGELKIESSIENATWTFSNV